MLNLAKLAKDPIIAGLVALSATLFAAAAFFYYQASELRETRSNLESNIETLEMELANAQAAVLAAEQTQERRATQGREVDEVFTRIDAESNSGRTDSDPVRVALGFLRERSPQAKSSASGDPIDVDTVRAVSVPPDP